MLVTLGLDSQFAMVDVLMAGFLDEFPTFRYGWKRTIVLTSVCLIGFLLGIPILTNGGYWFFNLINDYSAYHGLLILAFFLIVVQHFLYNFKTSKFRFVSDLEEMVGSVSIFTKGYFYSMWYLITPVMLLYVIITAFLGYDTIANNYRGVTEDAEDSPIQVFPEWSNTIGSYKNILPIFNSV
jgi:SNF family Na+-dependent transporter